MSDSIKVEEFNSVDSQENETVETEKKMKATKIGETSEFENDLFGKEHSASEDIENNGSVDAKEQTAKKEQGSKSELERYLDEESLKGFQYENGDIIQGVVRSIEKSGVLVDFNFKSDGFVSNSEIGVDDEGNQEVLTPGEEKDFFVEKLETKEGYAILSRKKAQAEQVWDELSEIFKSRETTKVRILSKVQGGLVAEFKGIKGFIPASQIIRENDEGMEQYIGYDLEVSILQTDRRRRKVIFSNKATRFKSRRDVDKILSELEVGQIRSGKVTSIKDFGVFVDIGGLEGLIHISELSWSRVNHPSDFVDVGDEIKVFILGVDRENKRISLGVKQLEPDPWVEVSSQYTLGDVVEGTISRIAPFGAFIKLAEKLEGLIHISELSNERVETVDKVVNVGDVVHAKIIKLIVDEQKIGLSLREVTASEINALTESKEVPDESADTVESVEENLDNSQETDVDKESVSSEVADIETE